jgi:hypothetical protein
VVDKIGVAFQCRICPDYTGNDCNKYEQDANSKKPFHNPSSPFLNIITQQVQKSYKILPAHFFIIKWTKQQLQMPFLPDILVTRWIK